MAEAAAADPKGLTKATNDLEKKGSNDKDKQIEELTKDVQVKELETKQMEHNIEMERKKEEVAKDQIKGLNPDEWLTQHPERAKIEALVKREGAKEAEKLLAKEKDMKDKAKADVAKKQADEEKKAKMDSKVKDAADSVKVAGKIEPPVVAEYGKPAKPVPVEVQ